MINYLFWGWYLHISSKRNNILCHFYYCQLQLVSSNSATSGWTSFLLASKLSHTQEYFQRQSSKHLLIDLLYFQFRSPATWLVLEMIYENYPKPNYSSSLERIDSFLVSTFPLPVEGFLCIFIRECWVSPDSPCYILFSLGLPTLQALQGRDHVQFLSFHRVSIPCTYLLGITQIEST